MLFFFTANLWNPVCLDHAESLSIHELHSQYSAVMCAPGSMFCGTPPPAPPREKALSSVCLAPSGFHPLCKSAHFALYPFTGTNHSHEFTTAC